MSVTVSELRGIVTAGRRLAADDAEDMREDLAAAAAACGRNGWTEGALTAFMHRYVEAITKGITDMPYRLETLIALAAVPDQTARLLAGTIEIDSGWSETARLTPGYLLAAGAGVPVRWIVAAVTFYKATRSAVLMAYGWGGIDSLVGGWVEEFHLSPAVAWQTLNRYRPGDSEDDMIRWLTHLKGFATRDPACLEVGLPKMLSQVVKPWAPRVPDAVLFAAAGYTPAETKRMLAEADTAQKRRALFASVRTVAGFTGAY